MANISYGMISPHPPLLIPEIGGERIIDVKNTDRSYDLAAKNLVSYNPDVVVFITPHGPISRNKIRICSSSQFYGDFAMFGLPFIKYIANGNTEFAKSAFEHCKKCGVNVELIDYPVLDHGVMVPLHYLNKNGFKKDILPIVISLDSLNVLFDFGKRLNQKIEQGEKKVCIVASADMSHSLTKDAPNGYNPNGLIFDKKLVELVKKNDVQGILNFDEQLAEEANQDALWSIAILLGIIDGLGFESEVLSYEGPFGVGYMVAEYKKKR